MRGAWVADTMRTPEDTPTDPDQLLRFGVVASVDLGAARCTVTLDQGVTTPPLRWLESRMGATRVWSPPSVGEQVMLLCPAGEIGGGVVLRGLPSDAIPPAGDSSRELIRFADGAVFAYDPEGHALAFTLPAGATTNIISDGGLAITGDITLTGTLTASADVLADGVSLKNHRHTAVQPGSGSSGAPA